MKKQAKLFVGSGINSVLGDSFGNTRSRETQPRYTPLFAAFEVLHVLFFQTASLSKNSPSFLGEDRCLACCQRRGWDGKGHLVEGWRGHSEL
jgi:hypothetical protein